MGTFEDIPDPQRQAAELVRAASRLAATQQETADLATALAEAAPALEVLVRDFIAKAVELGLPSDLAQPRWDKAAGGPAGVSDSRCVVSIDGTNCPAAPLGWECAWASRSDGEGGGGVVCWGYVLPDGKIARLSQTGSFRPAGIFRRHSLVTTLVNYSTEDPPYSGLWSILLGRTVDGLPPHARVRPALNLFEAGLRRRLLGETGVVNVAGDMGDGTTPDVEGAFRILGLR